MASYSPIELKLRDGIRSTLRPPTFGGTLVMAREDDVMGRVSGAFLVFSLSMMISLLLVAISNIETVAP